MSSDNKKKKKDSIKLSLEKLENSLVLAKQDGNSRQISSLEKCIKRLQEDLNKLKY